MVYLLAIVCSSVCKEKDEAFGSDVFEIPVMMIIYTSKIFASAALGRVVLVMIGFIVDG